MYGYIKCTMCTRVLRAKQPDWLHVGVLTHALSLPAYAAYAATSSHFLVWTNLATLSVVCVAAWQLHIFSAQLSPFVMSTFIPALLAADALGATVVSAGSFAFHSTEELGEPGHTLDIAGSYISRGAVAMHSVFTAAKIGAMACDCDGCLFTAPTALLLACALVYGTVARYESINGTHIQDMLVAALVAATLASAAYVRFYHLTHVVSLAPHQSSSVHRYQIIRTVADGITICLLIAAAFYFQGELLQTFLKDDERYYFAHGLWHIWLAHTSAFTLVALCPVVQTPGCYHVCAQLLLLAEAGGSVCVLVFGSSSVSVAAAQISILYVCVTALLFLLCVWYVAPPARVDDAEAARTCRVVSPHTLCALYLRVGDTRVAL